MFTELMPLLSKRRLLLTISLVEGDTIRTTVVPQKASETEDNALTTPLAITGTAEELDRDLPQQLVEFTGAHLRRQSTLASAKAEMEAAAKAAHEQARKKTLNRPARPAKQHRRHHRRRDRAPICCWACHVQSLASLGVLRRRCRQGLGPRDTRVLHPRLQQLEGPRLASDRVSATGERFESRRRQVTACVGDVSV